MVLVLVIAEGSQPPTEQPSPLFRLGVMGRTE